MNSRLYLDLEMCILIWQNVADIWNQVVFTDISMERKLEVQNKTY